MDICEAGGRRLAEVFAPDVTDTGARRRPWREACSAAHASGDESGQYEPAKAFFERQVKAADMKETNRLLATVPKWLPEIQTLLTTRVTTAKVEAANTLIKNIKRIGRGFRNLTNYQSRILLRSIARTVMNSSERAGIHHETRRAS